VRAEKNFGENLSTCSKLRPSQFKRRLNFLKCSLVPPFHDKIKKKQKNSNKADNFLYFWLVFFDKEIIFSSTYEKFTIKYT
jgi:hypothetical protein